MLSSRGKKNVMLLRGCFWSEIKMVRYVRFMGNLYVFRFGGNRRFWDF